MAAAAAVALARTEGKRVEIVATDELHAERIEEMVNTMIPPRRLSNEIGHPDYRPDFMRVGLLINGEERHDVNWYDVDRLRYDCIRVRDMPATSIEPYWRYPETRQLRRARERWERQHGKN